MSKEAFEESQQQEVPNLETANDNAGVEALRDKLTRLTQASRMFSEKDKKATLEWLATDKDRNDAEALRFRINEFPASERSVEKQVASYMEQIQTEIREGRFSATRAGVYEKWFLKDLSYEERAKYLKEKNTHLHNPRRKKVLEQFQGKVELNGVRIPTAVREEHKSEFDNSDLEGREALVKRLATRHKELKAAFLKLSPEMQAKYAPEFKESGLKDREKLIKAITGVSVDAQGAAPETAEEEKLMNAYKQKTQKMAMDDLLTWESKAAYDTWYESLSLNEKRTMATKSELDTRLQKRRNVRDEFNNLPPEVTAKHETKFRKADLDVREKILREIKGGADGAKSGMKYPEDIVRHTLEKTLDDKSLFEQRMVHTIVKESHTLRRRGEIVLNAKKTEDMAQKTKEKGYEVDEHKIVDLEHLQRRTDVRHHAKEFLVEKRAEGTTAKATNMTLHDRNHTEITSEQFETLVVDHQRKELIARLVGRASEKLPQADQEQMRKVADKLDLTMDLRKAVA